MNKQKKNISIIIGIASVWFGAHCGPGTASGRQTATACPWGSPYSEVIL